MTVVPIPMGVRGRHHDNLALNAVRSLGTGQHPQQMAFNDHSRNFRRVKTCLNVDLGPRAFGSEPVDSDAATGSNVALNQIYRLNSHGQLPSDYLIKEA
ncbi:hypothetical protein [Falsirhodobacter sp. 1013]|uniref:hypothetical protein n=1 Tax=Falsirhodobacter sp. 1013 TaxID=3417566 RepID=UPI003EBE4646